MMLPGKSKRGAVKNIIIIVGLVVALFFIVKNLGIGSSVQLEKAHAKQGDPESALIYYMQQAYDFTKMQGEAGQGFEGVKSAVPKDDWEWYLDNYETFSFDKTPFGSLLNINTAIDPNESKAINKRTSLTTLVSVGPVTPSVKVIDKKINSADATLTVQWEQEKDEFLEADISLVKEKDYWKVKDFAGGRTFLETRKFPSRLVDPASLQAAAAAAAPGASPAPVAVPGVAAPVAPDVTTPVPGTIATPSTPVIPAAAPSVTSAPGQRVASTPVVRVPGRPIAKPANLGLPPAAPDGSDDEASY